MNTSDYDDLTTLFLEILRQTGSVDMADAEFKRQMADDADLRSFYREWCHDQGSSERNGFMDFCEEYLESQKDIWDTLTDNFEE